MKLYFVGELIYRCEYPGNDCSKQKLKCLFCKIQLLKK